MENNKFVFLLSLIIAFGVWVAVAMYKSPQESFTIYNVPIQIDTENSIVSQKGYINFWQSDDKIDVTVNGPRYMINTITADDLIVTANLNSVDSAGISQLNLKVELKKVVWPTGKQTANNTLIVIACVVFIGVFIWIFDAVAVRLIQALIHLVAG